MTGHFENVRAHLEAERNRLNEGLHSKFGQSAVEAHEGSPFGKREETATESFQLESRLAAVRHTREQLGDVERALEKLAKGTYGLCDSCGKPIPPARLEAVPRLTSVWSAKLNRQRALASKVPQSLAGNHGRVKKFSLVQQHWRCRQLPVVAESAQFYDGNTAHTFIVGVMQG